MIDFSGQQEFQNVIVGRINRVAALIEFSYLKKALFGCLTVWVTFRCMGVSLGQKEVNIKRSSSVPRCENKSDTTDASINKEF